MDCKENLVKSKSQFPLAQASTNDDFAQAVLTWFEQYGRKHLPYLLRICQNRNLSD